MPPWTTIEADVDVVCKLHQSIPDVLAVEDIDCVVVGIFHQVSPLKYVEMARPLRRSHGFNYFRNFAVLASAE